MKNNKVTRLLAVLLSATMLFSLAACGQKTEESKQSSAAQSSAAQSSAVQSSAAQSSAAASSAPAELDREPITITWGNGSVVGEGVITDEIAVLQYIKEKFNIEIQFVKMDQEKFSLMAADGSLPDVCNLYGGDAALVNLIDSGRVLELSDLLNTYGQDILARTSDAAEAVMQDKFGGIYVLAAQYRNMPVNSLNSGSWVYAFRWDLWQEMGAPEFNNEDELLEILAEMQKIQREKTGNNNIWGFATHNAHFAVQFGANYGIDNTTKYGQGFNVVTGEMEHLYTDPDSSFWKAFEYYNKAWNMGIMDPESFTQDLNAKKAKIENGLVLSASGCTYVPDPKTNGENAIMSIPLGGFEYLPVIYQALSPWGSYDRMISANCKYPERIIELLNWLDTPEGCRVWCNGIQGVDWDYDANGMPVFIGEMAENYINNTMNDYVKTRIVSQNIVSYTTSTYDLFEDGYGGQIIWTKNYQSNNVSSAFKNYGKYYSDKFGVELGTPGLVYEYYVVNDMAKSGQVPIARGIMGVMGIPTDETAQIATEVTDLFNSRYAEIVMAEDFEAVKADVIAQCKEIGMDKADAEMQTLYEEALAKYEEVKPLLEAQY